MRATADLTTFGTMVGSAYRWRMAWLLLVGITLLCSHIAAAQTYPLPATWGGDIFSRPRLTGDWGGERDTLGKDGVVFDLDLLTTPQSVVSGGRNTGSAFWGNVDYTLNLDTQKLGLWPGGFFKFQADTGFGSNVFQDSGAIVPVNTAALIPGQNDRTTALMNATLTQFLSPQVGVFLGKINTLDVGLTEFYGDYRTQFENAMFAFPMTLEQVPFSTFGGGVIGIPRDDIQLSATVLGPNGSPVNNDVGQAFDGVMVLGSGNWTVKPFGLLGHQALNIEWNDKERFSLTQDPTNISTLLLQSQFPRLVNPGPALEGVLARFFPALLVPTQPANRSSSSWAMSYTFDQYFWQPDENEHHGIGLFFAFGASDGNPNPIQYSFLTGIGGKGVVPGRPDDNFGVGFARTQFSSDFVPLLRQTLNLGLQHEDGIEAYYNAALTGWLNLTLDLQVINPGLKKQLISGSGLASIDTAVILGTRLRIRF